MGTMFTIVALAYVIAGGALPDEPVSFQSRHTFLGLEACQDHLRSPVFAAEKMYLHQNLSVTAAIRAAATAEPPPSVIITATCQPDNRV